jgi:hypothetical protein
MIYAPDTVADCLLISAPSEYVLLGLYRETARALRSEGPAPSFDAMWWRYSSLCAAAVAHPAHAGIPVMDLHEAVSDGCCDAWGDAWQFGGLAPAGHYAARWAA